MTIILEHKGYKIEIVSMELWSDNKATITYNSYVTDPIFFGKEYGTGNCTYHSGNTIGFDTAHMYNHHMSEAELFVDAMNQAIFFIDNLSKDTNPNDIATL